MDGSNSLGNAHDSDEPNCTGEWICSDDGLKLLVRRWISQKPRAVLHLVHGMAEHSLRYDRLGRRFSQAGIEVWAADQRGHGKTADLGVNEADKGGLLGHCADKDGIAKVMADIHRINKTIHGIYPEVPLFLLGHSWGSFLTQNYIETCTYPLAGCILSGTRGPDGLKIKMSVPVMALLALLTGPRKGSRLARAFADGPFSKPFKPNRTPFDWLSRDEKEVDAYYRDPIAGMLCSAGFYRDLSALLYQIHKAEAMNMIRRDLPIYVFSGNADPVGDMGASPTALVNAYRSIGIRDLEFVLYPDARHETLNETNREEVTENLLDWISRHCRP
ncbi:MAG: lysophospholipase [Treponema sp.]|jgi:alpha-beta hydrolase superfamily lysophospholipase|nr:lysophospholipase [Treponema sp.]